MDQVDYNPSYSSKTHFRTSTFFRWIFLMQQRGTRRRSDHWSFLLAKNMDVVHQGIGLPRAHGCRYVKLIMFCFVFNFWDTVDSIGILNCHRTEFNIRYYTRGNIFRTTFGNTSLEHVKKHLVIRHRCLMFDVNATFCLSVWHKKPNILYCWI